MNNQTIIVIAENSETDALPPQRPSQSDSIVQGLPPRRPNGCCFRLVHFFQRKWTSEKVARTVSNGLIFLGCLVALIFTVYSVKDVADEYLMLTIFIIAGTLFGGGCLMALVNVSWMSRRPGIRVSPIQMICNVVLVLITAYLELLFWSYPKIAYTLLFVAGIPMVIMINLPSCFVLPYSNAGDDGEDTVCLDQDALDDATVAGEEELQKTGNADAECVVVDMDPDVAMDL